jgi:hypothetical protein
MKVGEWMRRTRPGGPDSRPGRLSFDAYGDMRRRLNHRRHRRHSLDLFYLQKLCPRWSTTSQSHSTAYSCKRPRESRRYFVDASDLLLREGLLYSDFFLLPSEAYSSEFGPNCASTCVFAPSIAL